MKNTTFVFAIIMLYFSITPIAAQKSGTLILEDVERARFRKEISLPDIPGYITLKCDFHMHTVFSRHGVA